jgi:ferrochelatase
VDCLETLEEIAMQNRDFFVAAGGESLRYIPALNDSRGQIESLAALVLQHTRGWDEFAIDYDAAAARQRRLEAGRHARELGARAD